jgi:hypothetical protein
VKFGIENGKLSISIADLLDALSLEEKRELAQRIGCERDVIKAVVDQLVDGWTENISRGPSDQISECRVRILEAVADVRFKVVSELMSRLAVAEYNASRTSEWAWKMWHAWPESHYATRPNLPAFLPNFPTEFEVRAVADGAKPEETP